MAWPLTPLTTYVANSTPAIKSADLNSIQSAINSIYTGGLTLKQLQIDGTGGAASSVGSGNISVSNAITIAGSGLGGGSVANGTLFKENTPYAWANITYNSSSPTINKNFNIASVVEASLGTVNVSLSALPPNANFCVISSPTTLISGAVSFTNPILFSATNPNFGISVYNSTGTLARGSFNFVVFAG